MALKIPRFIEITVHENLHVQLSFEDCQPLDINHYKSRCLPPALTGVCPESRALASKFYTRAFTEGTEPRYAYINFDIDTIVMEDGEAYTLHAKGKDRHLIQRLILYIPRYNSLSGFATVYSHGERGITNMRNLRSLVLAATDWNPRHMSDYGENLRFRFKDDPERKLDWAMPEFRFVGRGDSSCIGFDLEGYLTKISW